MKVYVVVMWLPYEGSYLEEVFSTQEKAQAYATDKKSNDRYGEYEVVEKEVK